MDEAQAEELLEQVLTGDLANRRTAFLELVGSDHWRMVLAPHVISKLCDGEDEMVDATILRRAAPLIAANEEQIHRMLELAGSRCTSELLYAVAQHMGADFVEHGLDHLRTAEGERAILLEDVLHESDPFWVRERGARRAIRGRLKTTDPSRIQLLVWLADAGNLEDFVEDLREYPPRYQEEWSALGRRKIAEEGFINRALALLGASPEPLAYLLRLDPVPPQTQLRAMAAAKSEWLLAALEVAIADGLDSRELIPMVELATRLGGRHLAAGIAWLNLAKLGPKLLGDLADQMRTTGQRRLSGLFWVQRRAPSANRALEQGRKDEEPDLMDAAALVRQLQGARMQELVREILEHPRPLMMQTVLRSLCGVNTEAAAEVVALARSVNPDVAQRAREALGWADVQWPVEEPESDLPASFTPLGEGI